MFDKFSAEEMNLICIYNTDNRTALLLDLHSGLADVYDPDMRELFDSAIEKLQTMTDEEFADIRFYAADEYIGEEV